MKTLFKTGIFLMMFLASFTVNAQYSAPDSNTSGTNRTFVGVNAGANNTGAHNSFYGRNAGYKNTTGYSNSFFGVNAGYNTTTGYFNTFLGVNAGITNTTGDNNVFLGRGAGYYNSGNNNTFIGKDAGYRNYYARSGGVFIGHQAGYYETANNILIISNSSTSQPLIRGDFANKKLALNANVGIGTGNGVSLVHKLLVGGSALASSWVTSSDKRYKKDIQTIDSALDKINALNGVTYNFKEETINNIDFSEQKGKKQIGFIAQELKEVFPELVIKDEAGYYGVNYTGLIPVLVEAAKEQQDEITDLRTRLEKLESLLNDTETIQGNLTPANDIDLSGVVLRQNAPNPFRGSTTIEYQLPENINVASLVVSDLNGRTVATYDISEKGTVQFDANGLDSGIYVYAIIAGGKSIASQKMVIQK